MNLRNLDLNLLVVFDAVMDTRNVTAAASRLHMAQPSMSHALRRLRDALQDELFIRTPQGMVPTPKAERLAAPVRAALAELQAALAEKPVFSPGTAERRFIIAMNNRAALTLPAPLAAKVRAQAPGILLDIPPSGTRDVLEQLDQEKIDLAIGGAVNPGDRFSQLTLMEDRYVAVLRNGHKLAPGTSLSLEILAALPHLLLSSTGDSDDFVDATMARHGLKRQIGLRAPLLAAAAALQQSDMVAVMSEHAAKDFAQTANVKVMQLPFSSPVLTTTMLWHRRFDVDPAHQWIRSLIAEVATAGLDDALAKQDAASLQKRTA
jgi:DNA-binding transcriptional LysR family regulator